MNWGLLDVNQETKNDKSESVWRTKSSLHSDKKDMILMTILNLARESTVNNINGDEIWRVLLKNIRDMNLFGSPASPNSCALTSSLPGPLPVSPLLPTPPAPPAPPGPLTENPLSEENQRSCCLSNKQAAEVVYKTGQEFNINYDWNTWNPDEDISFGIQLYSAVHYCPDHLIEAAKLFHFFDNLIQNHSLNTVVAATIQTIQQVVGDSVKDFTAINMWHEKLDERYNFSLAPIITPLPNLLVWNSL